MAELAPDQLSEYTEAIERAGFCLLSNFDLHGLVDFGRLFGLVTTDPRSPFEVRGISPEETVHARPNTLSSRHGLGVFPFHTDNAHWHKPAVYYFLHCTNPGRGNRPTHLIDTHEWELSSDERRVLSTGVWRTGHVRSRLCTIISDSSDKKVICRYDLAFMAPVSKSGEDSRDIFERYIQASHPRRVEWHRNDLLILDNHRMLHARGKSAVSDKDRVLNRLLIGGRAA